MRGGEVQGMKAPIDREFYDYQTIKVKQENQGKENNKKNRIKAKQENQSKKNRIAIDCSFLQKRKYT